MKRIITIQDISCVGRCSLTAALPIISALGVETAILPTALLSTHTAFPKFTFRDLTDEMQTIADTLKELSIDFDAVYTGYLGSLRQIELVEHFIDDFKTKNNAVFIDPVMGDRGLLYKGFTQDFADKMTQLCQKADIILPNLTEASFMLHIPYREDYTEADIRTILKQLTALGIKCAALTGISLQENRIGVYCYDSEKDEYFSYFNEKMPSVFHGTGDVFASCALGAYVRGCSLPEALTLAVDYTLECIRLTLKDPNARFYGVNFEQALPMLIRQFSNL